jgi:hypothetical protein
MPQRRGRVDDQSLNRCCGGFTGTGVPARCRSVSATTSSSSPSVSTLTAGTPALEVLNRLYHLVHREVVMVSASSVQNLIHLLHKTSPPRHPRFVFLTQSPLNAAQRRDQVVIIPADTIRVHLQLFWQRVSKTLQQDRIAGRALQFRQADGEVLQTVR